MEAAFELTDADLHEVQRHRLMRRREWARRWNLPVVGAATALATAIVGSSLDVPPALLAYCGVLAGLVVLLLVRRGLQSDRSPACTRSCGA